MRRCDADALRVDEGKVVQRQNGIAREKGPRADMKNGLHELIAGSAREVLEPVHPPPDVLEATPLVQLAELDRRNIEFLGVPSGDVAILVERPLPQAAAICLLACHLLQYSQNRTVFGTVLPNTGAIAKIVLFPVRFWQGRGCGIPPCSRDRHGLRD